MENLFFPIKYLSFVKPKCKYFLINWFVYIKNIDIKDRFIRNMSWRMIQFKASFILCISSFVANQFV